MNTMTIAYNLVFEYLEELLYEDFLNLDTETQSEIDYKDFENYVFNGECEIVGYLRNVNYTNFTPPNGFRTGEKIHFMEDFVVDILSPFIKESIKNVEESELHSHVDKFEDYLSNVTFVISDVNNAYCGKDFCPPNGKLDIDYILKYDIKEQIEGYKVKMDTKEETASAPISPVGEFPKEWTTK